MRAGHFKNSTNQKSDNKIEERPTIDCCPSKMSKTGFDLSKILVLNLTSPEPRYRFCLSSRRGKAGIPALLHNDNG